MPGPLGMPPAHGPLVPPSQQSSQSVSQSQTTNGTSAIPIASANLLNNLSTDSQTPLPPSATSVNSSAQSTSSPPYFGDQTTASSSSQPSQSSDGSLVSSPISPHLQSQANGFPVPTNGTTPSAGSVTVNGQIGNYSQQQQQQPPPPSNGSQGTWTGQNTLSYTQSIPPNDPRAPHNNYCEFSISPCD